MGLEDKRIAVIGGGKLPDPIDTERSLMRVSGLGGLAFMNSAVYAGLQNIHLYEAAAEFTEVGAGVNITRNANRVLDAFGLKESMLARSSRDPPSYMEYRHYRTGEDLGSIAEFGEPRSRQIHRAHLLEVLLEKVPEEKISKNKRLVEISKCDRGEFSLQFQDGTSSKADIVVGCDGIKSKVRQHLGFTDVPIYSGQMVYRGYVSYTDLTPQTADLLRKTVNFRGPKRHILTLPIGNQEAGNDRVGIIGFMTEPLENWKSESWLATAPVDDLHEHVRDWTGAVQEIIHGLKKESPYGQMLKQALYVRSPADKWYDAEPESPGAGIVLLGDSIHSTLPHQGT